MAVIDLLLRWVMTSWLGWVLIFLAHSTLWASGAWLLGQRPLALAPRARNLVWRVALVGPLLTASLHFAAGPAWTVHEVAAVHAGAATMGPPTAAEVSGIDAVPPVPGAYQPRQLGTHAAAAPQVPGTYVAAQVPGNHGPGDSYGSAPVRPDRGWSGADAQAPLEWSALIWWLAAGVTVARLVGLGARMRRVRQALADRRAVRDPRALATLSRLRLVSRRRLDVRLSVVDGLASPIAFGRDEICLPPRALRDLDDRALAAVLAHEVAHLERADNRWLLISAALEAALFFQPAYRVARRQLQQSAELASDERAVELTGDSLGLARSLATVAAWGVPEQAALASAVVSAPSPLLERAQRLLASGRRERGARWTGPVASGVLAAVVVLSPGLALHGATAPVDESRGLWLVELDPNATPDKGARLELRYGTPDRHREVGTRVDPAQLVGPSRTDVLSESASVRFAVKRDAGTFQCQGTFRHGQGAGHFQFQPNPAFVTALRQRGFDAPTPDQTMTMALHDLGLALVDELKAQGYERPTLDQLIRMANHGVRLDYLRGLKALGYRPGTVERVVKMRDHGVTLEYIKELVAAGYAGMPAEELIRARDHGVSPGYIKELRAAGFAKMSMDEVVRMRDHGVSAEYIRALKDAGHSGLTLEDVRKARDHGVSPEFLKAMGELGFRNTSLKDVIRTRDHGVGPDYIRELRALGYQKLSLEDLIDARNHGVSPSWVRELNQVGYAGLEVDRLIKLRNHGVDADFIRKVEARGIRRPSVEDLVKYRSRGFD